MSELIPVNKLQHPVKLDRSLNLVENITKLLEATGHTNPTAWLSKLPDQVRECKVDLGQVMFVINDIFRIEIASIPEDKLPIHESQVIRFGLVNGVSPDSWFEVIALVAAPCIVKHNLFA